VVSPDGILDSVVPDNSHADQCCARLSDGAIAFGQLCGEGLNIDLETDCGAYFQFYDTIPKNHFQYGKISEVDGVLW
jgi:hypothetical protein